MLLYVNGDSHSAGAELYRSDDGKLVAFTEDDSVYWNTIGTPEGRRAHPKCVELSYGQRLATLLDVDLICDAVSGSSNDRIINSTLEYLKYGFEPDLIVIGWSTWERVEWEYQGRKWQINASGIADDWPDAIKKRYKDWILSIDYNTVMQDQHIKIFMLHGILTALNIKHLFFNSFQELNVEGRLNWNDSYLYPYDRDYTYYNWCTAQGFKVIDPKTYHFGADAHAAWANFLYQQYVHRILTAK